MGKLPISEPPPEILAAANEAPKRKPQRNRVIAKKAADDIRAFRFACIYEAADAYFPELAGGKGEKERRKNFVKYVYEDLEKGPKSIHVFWAMSRYSIKRNEQVTIKENRLSQTISNLKKL